MNLYRHKENQLLYTIHWLVKDIHFLNCGAFEGIYATPFFGKKDEVIKHTYGDFNEGRVGHFNPIKFVKENFDIVCELRNL